MQIRTPSSLKNDWPLDNKSADFISASRMTTQQILGRHDPRLLIIIGPCSIHSVEEGLSYAESVRNLVKEHEEHCFLMMRAYIEKPRTKGGWKGLVHDPHLNGSEDIDCGLAKSRSFLLELAKMRVPAATEFLTPLVAPYIQDLISWGCVGARSSSSPLHRILASHLPLPIGFKNSIDGNVDCAIHAMGVARCPHTFLHMDDEGRLQKIRSKGNPYTHVVLRGSKSKTNFDRASVQETLDQLRQMELPSKVLIDCSHGNAQGKYYQQKEVFEEVLKQVREGNQQILGMMLESHIEAGSQTIPANLLDLQSGVSVTDPCIDFSTTAELIDSVSSSSKQMSLTHS